MGDMAHDGPNEGAPQPTVGPGGDRSVADGPEAGLRRARSETCVAHEVSGSAESLDGQRLGGDEQCTVGTDARDGLEQSDGWDLSAHTLDPAIECLDHRSELRDEFPLHADEQTPLVSEQGPGLGSHPPASILGEQAPTLEMKPDVVELGVDAVDHLRALPHQPGSVA